MVSDGSLLAWVHLTCKREVWKLQIDPCIMYSGLHNMFLEYWGRADHQHIWLDSTNNQPAVGEQNLTCISSRFLSSSHNRWSVLSKVLTICSAAALRIAHATCQQMVSFGSSKSKTFPYGVVFYVRWLEITQITPRLTWNERSFYLLHSQHCQHGYEWSRSLTAMGLVIMVHFALIWRKFSDP